MQLLKVRHISWLEQLHLLHVYACCCLQQAFTSKDSSVSLAYSLFVIR
jgi:hypothetical protein